MIVWTRKRCLVLAVLGLAALPAYLPAQTDEIQKQLQAQIEAQKQLQLQLKALQDAQQRMLFLTDGFVTNRLGATLESPSAAVAAQLDLPQGRGQVIKTVQANSAAAKAGIQANDILLEVDGKAVSSNMGEFQKTINALKPNAGVEALVLRKGQKVTIKDLMLPAAAQANNPFGNQFGVFTPPAPVVQGINTGLTRVVMPNSPQVPGQVLPTEVQGQLKLSAEQKEKLAKLQKDTEAKLMELLTDEQKKQLQTLKTSPQRLNPAPGQPVPDGGLKRPEGLNRKPEALPGQVQIQAPAQVQAVQDVQDKVIQIRNAVRGASGNRLGATLETPSDTVANQLNLPAGQGLVVKTVPANSAAAKAGLQPNDILLELGGKTISRNPAEFDKAVEPIKPETPVEAVVLRKGEKTTLKGVALAAAQPVAQPARFVQMMNAPKVPGEILPGTVQGQLKLTAEQKDKLAKLQKDTEAKLMELLTDEQKKQLEDLKKNARALPLKILIDGNSILEEIELELIPGK